MKKEDYVLEQKILQQQINNLKIEMYETEKKYLAENREFADGELVTAKFRNRSENVFIVKAGVHTDGDIFYKCHIQKKDGTMSKLKASIYDAKLEKITI